MGAANLALLCFVPNMALSKHHTPYDSFLLCSSIAAAGVVCSVAVFAGGSLWQRVLATLLLPLPAFVFWNLFRHGLP